jgi:TonB family protein
LRFQVDLVLWYFAVMFNPSRLVFRFAFLFAGLAFVTSSAGAQFSRLDTVGEDLAKKLKPHKFHMIAVADLTEPDGSSSSQGHYFALFLSTSIRHHGKKKVPVADQAAFDALLREANMTPGDLSSAEYLKKISTKANLDVIVLGTIEKSADSYNVQVKAVQIRDGVVLDTQRTSFRRSDFTDSLSEPFPKKTDFPVSKALVSGVKPPGCVRCPQPSYNDYARREKIQGTSLFEVMVSTEGRAVQIHPKRLIGYGLDEEAFDAIKRWQFKPGERDGQPIAVIVDIEVTFHLY